MMLFPAGSGPVRAALGNGGDGFDCGRCKVLLWRSGQVSGEGMGWSEMAQNRAVKAVPCTPGDSPASKPQLRGQGDPACLPHAGDGSVSGLGGTIYIPPCPGEPLWLLISGPWC